MSSRNWLRYLSFRWNAVGTLNGVAHAILPSRRTGTAYLAAYQEAAAAGPLQREEALLIHALTRVVRPRTVVEFGFFLGHSANVFLKAADEGVLVISYDVDKSAPKHARRSFGNRKNFRLLLKSQTEFNPADVDNRPVDLALIDACHDLDLNKQAFEKLLPSLADDAIVISHDTGTWAEAFMLPSQHDWAAKDNGVWIEGEGYAHAPDERRFIDWICDTYPEFSAMHFHSKNTLRHGITMVQRKKRLADRIPDA